jgi:hypothetical protein
MGDTSGAKTPSVDGIGTLMDGLVTGRPRGVRSSERHIEREKLLAGSALRELLSESKIV